eukprot:372692-Pelagomonas_calceolata.AAC.8
MDPSFKESHVSACVLSFHSDGLCQKLWKWAGSQNCEAPHVAGEYPLHRMRGWKASGIMFCRINGCFTQSSPKRQANKH